MYFSSIGGGIRLAALDVAVVAFGATLFSSISGGIREIRDSVLGADAVVLGSPAELDRSPACLSSSSSASSEARGLKVLGFGVFPADPFAEFLVVRGGAPPRILSSVLLGEL